MKKAFAFLSLLSINMEIIANEKIDSGYAEVNGTKLYYELAGSGETIILIHGSFGDRRFWDLQFQALSNSHRVLRYDVRGFGKSALPKPHDVYKDADDLNALMNFLKINKAHICGLSMGSVILFDFALAYPYKCVSLISCGPRIAGDGLDEYRTPNSDTVKAIIARTVQIVKAKGAKQATDYLWSGDHVMTKGIVSPITRTALLKMGYEYSWWRYLNAGKREFAFPTGIKELNKIKIPTIIITAEFDLELCKDIAVIMKNEMPQARLISIKNAGHIMNMDQPEEFNKIISEFIEKLK